METGTHAAMERLAADSGLTSATSLAFCRAIFWLAASSSSCSSCGEEGNQRAKRLNEVGRKESIERRNGDAETSMSDWTAAYLGQFLRVGQIVHGDGQEHVQQCVWTRSQRKSSMWEFVGTHVWSTHRERWNKKLPTSFGKTCWTDDTRRKYQKCHSCVNSHATNTSLWLNQSICVCICACALLCFLVLRCRYNSLMCVWQGEKRTTTTFKLLKMAPTPSPSLKITWICKCSSFHKSEC